MPEEEKKVVTTTETVKETEKEKAEAEKHPDWPVPTKVVVEKKADEVFVSVSPVGSKEYTDALAAWELEHAVKSE